MKKTYYCFSNATLNIHLPGTASSNISDNYGQTNAHTVGNGQLVIESTLHIYRCPKGYVLQSHHPSPDFCSIPNPYGFYGHPTTLVYWHFGILPPPICF